MTKLVVAYTLLFVVSLLGLAVLSSAICYWQMILDLPMILKVKVVATFVAPVLSVLLIPGAVAEFKTYIRKERCIGSEGFWRGTCGDR